MSAEEKRKSMDTINELLMESEDLDLMDLIIRLLLKVKGQKG